MRICILAGGERTGKSTLAGEFADNGWEYVHFDPPKGSPYEEYKGFAEKTLSDPANRDRKYVLDRYMYCEFPYSRHFGRSTDMTVPRMNDIEKTILALDPAATVVYCENDIDVNWHLIQDEGKREFRSKDEVEALRRGYREVLDKSLLRTVRYDFTAGDMPEGTYKAVADGSGSAQG